MIVAIQCAATKNSHPGHLHAVDGRRVVFVARPELAPAEEGVLWARPDDPADDAGLTWRQVLSGLDDQARARAGLLKASELYRPESYRTLVATFGPEHVYILSAGWGLVRSDCRLPTYDITFSGQADAYKRRRPSDIFQDFMQLPERCEGPIVFLGGKDYLPLYRKLTEKVLADKVVFRRAGAGACQSERLGKWSYIPYVTARKTNWHYDCAAALCANPGMADAV